MLALCAGLLTVSCQKEMEVDEIISESHLQMKSSSADTLRMNFTPIKERPALRENLRDLLVNNAVEPSECGPTEFVAVQNLHLTPVINDLYFLFGEPNYATIFYLYMDLNFYHAYLDTSEDQYFGPKGEYTKLVTKRQRDLEKFWGMPGMVRINGQHSATLNDREKLADIYEIVGTGITTREQAYAAADQILYFNTFSDLLPESPFFSVDGFATSFGLIVLGDGLVQMVSEAGVEPEITYTGILAHEWAHQVQFQNYATWYPEGANADHSAATRHTELEADFLASYYMTHKRGATYNWKRAEQFFNLFFQIGDCSFASTGHHGTPLQRLDAARLGYELAQSEQKQGHILSAQELHDFFMANVDSLL